jgi:AraC family transcriptional regulator
MNSLSNQFLSLPLGLPPEVTNIGAYSRHGARRKREVFRLHDLWCLNLFIQGTGALHLQDKEYCFCPGFAGITPPDCDFSYDYQQETLVTFAWFIPKASSRVITIPHMVNLGTDFESVLQGLQSIATPQITDRERSSARVWDILWQIGRHSSLTERHQHAPLLDEALELIERHLSKSIYVQDMAATLGVSYSHLNRLFVQEFKIPVNRYIKQKRVERANHLLKNSSLSIQSIGEQVGIPDPHLFNKIIRHELGKSPRKLRGLD